MPAISRPPATAAFLTARFDAGPFSQADALAAGVSRAQLRAALDTGHLVRVRHGVMAPADAVAALRDPVERHVFEARALLQALRARPGGLADGAALSHATATAVRGMPYPGLRRPSRWPVSLSDAAPGGRQATGWMRHARPVPPEHRTVIDGLPVTSAARTAVDVATAVPLVRALPVVDAAMRHLCLAVPPHLAVPVEDRLRVRDPRVVAAVRSLLAAVLDETEPARVRGRTLLTLEAGDPAAENGFESVSRAHVLRAGLPRPEVGYPVLGGDGQRYWADLAWPELRVLGEADGHGKYTDLTVLYAEKDRQEALERAGWIVVRWTWDELARTPHVVVARIAAALERARGRRAA